MKRIALAAIVAVLLTACGQEQQPSPASPAAGSEGKWSELPSGPLSARSAAHAFEIAGEFFLMGGNDAPPCPPNADCISPSEAPMRDGAAFDPATGEWRTLAEAPLPLGYGSGAVVGDRIYLLIGAHGSTHPSVREAFLVYDASEDAWRELRLPPDTDSLTLTATEETVVAYRTTQENGVKPDYVYEAGADAWTKLPVDPLVPSFDRSLVWTDEGLVLLGIESVDQPGVKPSIYRAAVLRDGSWTRLEDSEVVGYNPMWSFVGGNVVNINIDMIDGGETNNYGRFFPTGGMLDPAAERWTELSDIPERHGGFDAVYATGDRGVVSGQGWVFDGGTHRWHELTRPPGGPDNHTYPAAAWVGDRLIVWGGTTYDGNEGEHLDRGWIWQAPW